MKQSRLDERRDKILAKANEQARQILADAKASADETIRNINKLAAKSGTAKDLEKERQKLRDKLNKVDSRMAAKPKKPRKTYRPEDFRIGDAVRVLSLNLNGIVSSRPQREGGSVRSRALRHQRPGTD